ncbi:MAG: hypothetical protein IJH67_08610 [Thermoguttaceae bacterium]|nr:hypothetical protein [Thermoguttaceae bacterium]
MNSRQRPLMLNRFLAAIVCLAVGAIVVFSTANGNGTSTAVSKPTVNSLPNTDQTERGKENAAAPDSNSAAPSGNAATQENASQTSAPPRPERMMSIGIRKVYAPESEATRWPLGNKKYTFINAQKFESNYKLWKELLSDLSSQSQSPLMSADVCIESARYYGTASDSGELSGWGEWKVVVNRQLPDVQTENVSSQPSDSNNDSKTTNEKSLDAEGRGMRKAELFLSSELKILLTDFVFYDASVKSIPEPKNELISNESSPLQADSETQYPVETNVVSASFPNGQTVLFVPSDGTIRFRWKAKQLDPNDYLIQSFGSVESLWTIDVPANQKLTLRSDRLNNDSKQLCANVTKEKVKESDSWRYSIRWSESETAIVHIGLTDEQENRFDRFYQQQTTYTFTPYHLNTQCRITFEPDSRSGIPQEIPFTVIHDPRVIWEASIDGQPAEIRITESGYSVSLRKCKTDNPRPELLLTSNCPLGDVKNESLEPANENGSASPGFSTLSLPRIELQSGRWQNGTAVIYTLQPPRSIETDKCSVVDFKRVAIRRFQTIVEQETPDADVVLVIEPFKELFYSQTQTVVQWDGSQATFNSTIELQAEEGRLYALTAVLPEGLTIVKASAEEQPEQIEAWEVNADSDNPAKRTLTIYLRKSLSPGRSLVLNIQSHAIADWSKPIKLNQLAPIVFDNFESHTQILYVNVALNQRFVVGDRVLYSPELGAPSADSSVDSTTLELPIGIDCFPHSSPANGTGTGRLDAYEFCIDLKMWGNCLASLEPVHSDYAVNAKTTIWVDKNSMEEKIELAFTGERSHLSQFRFSYGQPSDAQNSWQGLLVWADNRYKVKVEPVEGNVYSIDIPMNASSPFTVHLSRRIGWNQRRAFESLGTNDGSRLTASVNIYSMTPQLFDVHANGMRFVKSVSDNADFTIGTYEYDSQNDKKNSENNNSASSASDDAAAPRIEISTCTLPKSDVSIWAWSQLVEERHFASGEVLTSVQWAIENRYPSQDSIQDSDTSNTRLKITLPTATDNSHFGAPAFLTGVRIDNESLNGDNIIPESENSYYILLPPQKKFFVLTVQWTCFDKPLKTCSSFHPQKPILDIPVLQSSWNLYYPTCYRRLNAFLSSDPSVDGWLERFFGPLLRHDSTAIMNIVSHIWDADHNNSDAKEESLKTSAGNDSSSSDRIKADSNAVFPALYTLPDNAPWNCCKFDGAGAPHTIRIVRSEVSECIRWLFFIITVTIILSLYFKRSDLLQTENANGETGGEKKRCASWGFRRWICVFGVVCCFMCQALPWFMSLFFSGAFLGVFVCLIVLAVPISSEDSNGGDDSNSVSRVSCSTNRGSRISAQSLHIIIFAAAVLLQTTAFGQESVLPPPNERYITPGAPEKREYEIFIPVDRQNHPKSGYYVPQELLDLMQTRENQSPERSWIICRSQYFGKLIQKPRQTESGLWKCAIEIETLSPNADVDLPVQLKETLSVTSNISVSRGRILKSSGSKPDENNSDDSKSETLYWSWDKLDNQSVLQWNLKNERWGIRLAQPGRYLIEAEFRPTIVVKDHKNEISFPILKCVNSTLELLVPENLTGLEFPSAFGGVTELTPNLDMPDPSIPVQPGLKLKRVQLGAAKQLTVLWNSGGFLSDGPVFDVDTITWWNVSPDSVDVKIKYNVKVVSGSVASIEIKADERLALLSESAVRRQDSQNDSDSPNTNEPELQDDPFRSENREERGKELNSASSARNSSSKTNSAPLQSDVRCTVIPNPDKPGSITVEFDSPITSQTSFELHYIWKDAVGVGRLQFPTTSVESSRSGQRSLAFTFDPRLQYECTSESLTPMPALSFWELWRGFEKQNASLSDKENISTDRGNGRAAAESIPNNRTETDSAAKQISTPSSPQNSANLPTVAYDLNLSRRKTDSSGVVDSVVMNVQRTRASSEGTAEAYILVDWDRLMWQIKWTINITRGQQSGYTVTLPELMCKPENNLSIISASVNTTENGSEHHLYPVNSSVEGKELKLYWGVPIEGKCQLIVTGEFRPDYNGGNSDSLRKIGFDFPEIQTLNVTQYKLAIGRTDDCAIQTVFDKPTPKAVVWTQAELSVESPFSSRNQRLLETWQTTINDTSKRPCALSVEIQKNIVDAEIAAVINPVQDNASELIINGRVKVNQGILDEFLLDIPENCFAPISSKTTLKCELDALSISQRRYILRPLSPFASDSEFELTIPLKKPKSGKWKLEKLDSVLWSLVCAADQSQLDDEKMLQKDNIDAVTSSETSSVPEKTRRPESAIKVFGLKMYVKPISESEYCAAAEFACAVSGTDDIFVRLPKGSTTLNVQIDQRSVRWIENKTREICVPIITENDPVDVRIVYTSAFNRTLYTDPMKFEPPTIEQTQQPDILWIAAPWKNLSHLDPGAVRATSFINKQIWLINDLNSQFQYLQQSAENISPIALSRLSRKLDEIESQLKQYQTRGEKPRARTISDSIVPRPNAFNRTNLTATETGAIHLAMQNVLRLREAIKEKTSKNEIQKYSSSNQETKDYFSLLANNSEALDSKSAAPSMLLVGTSDPGTAFTLAYSLSPASAPTASIWLILSMLFIPVIIWLTFFPPDAFIIWRPAFVLGCLSVIWLLYFNLYGVSILLFIVALFDALNKFRQRSKRNIIPLRVR